MSGRPPLRVTTEFVPWWESLRELEEKRAELDRVCGERDRYKSLALWLVSMDEPGSADRQMITLARIIDRARGVLEGGSGD